MPCVPLQGSQLEKWITSEKYSVHCTQRTAQHWIQVRDNRGFPRIPGAQVRLSLCPPVNPPQSHSPGLPSCHPAKGSPDPTHLSHSSRLCGNLFILLHNIFLHLKMPLETVCYVIPCHTQRLGLESSRLRYPDPRGGGIGD